jgi:hypothetical protein
VNIRIIDVSNPKRLRGEIITESLTDSW